MADLSQFIQALYPDRGTPDEPRIMTPESANRPTGRSQQEVDDAFPLLLRAMAAAQQHMVPPMGGSASPVMRGARRPPQPPRQPPRSTWEEVRDVSPLKVPYGLLSDDLSLAAPPVRSGPLKAEPTIAENDPFRKIVAAKLAAQGGVYQAGGVRTPPGSPMSAAQASHESVSPGGVSHWIADENRYPWQDEPGSFKHITMPETELQRKLWEGYGDLDNEYAKWHFEPGSELDKRVIGRGMDRKSPNAALGDAITVGNPGGPVRPGAPWAAGQQINKDLLWGPAPTFQGEQWKGTKEDLAKLIELQKQLGGKPPIFPNSAD